MTEATPETRKKWRETMAALLLALSKGGTSSLLGHPTPYLDGVTELRCMWFDDLYHQPAHLVLDGVISVEERTALDLVEVALSAAAPEGEPCEHVEEVARMRPAEWCSLVSAAGRVLSFFAPS